MRDENAPASQGDEDAGEAVKMTTALKILVLLDERAPTPLSTHSVGLQIQDPKNSLSVIMKTLARDGYIRRAGDNGKRTALWELTDIGKRSILRRSNASIAARAWLRQHPGLDQIEHSVLHSLYEERGISPSKISEATGARMSAVRDALRDLVSRSLVSIDPSTETVALSANGAKVRLQLQSPQDDKAGDFTGAGMPPNLTQRPGLVSTTGDTRAVGPDAIRKAISDKLEASEKLLKIVKKEADDAQQNVRFLSNYVSGLKDALNAIDAILPDFIPKSLFRTAPTETDILRGAAELVPPASRPGPHDETQRATERAQTASVQLESADVNETAKRGRGRPRKNALPPVAREATSLAQTSSTSAAPPNLTTKEVNRLGPRNKTKIPVRPVAMSATSADKPAKAGGRKSGSMKKAILMVVVEGGEAGLSRAQILKSVEKSLDGGVNSGSLRTTLFALGKAGLIKSEAGNWTVNDRSKVDALISA